MRLKLIISALVLLLPPLVMASSTGGSSGQGQFCKPSPVSYCARTDQGLMPYSTPIALTPAGATGTLFIDPDTGMTIDRITNINTGVLTNGCCFQNSSAEVNNISTLIPSLFSGDGGYVLDFRDQGQQYYFTTLDAKTGAVSQLTSGTNPNGFNSEKQIQGFAPQGPTYFSDTSGSGIVYGVSSSATTKVAAYDTINDQYIDASGNPQNSPATYRYDFAASCPNWPTITGVSTFVLFGGVRKDRYIGAAFGGSTGQVEYVNAWVDLNTGNCYWWDHYNGFYGGTGITSTATGNGLVPTPLIPTAFTSSPSGGPLTVCAVFTSSSSAVKPSSSSASFGQTLPSPEKCVASALGSTVTLTFPAFANPWDDAIWGCTVYDSDAAPCTPYSVYMDITGTGNEILQTGSTPVSGPTYSIAVSSIITGACAGTTCPPTATTAGYNSHQAVLSTTGLLTQDTNGPGFPYFWTPPNAVVLCPADTSGGNWGCETGHRTGGAFNLINVNGIPFGSNNGQAVSIRPYATPYVPSTIPALVATPPPSFDAQDSHVSWNLSVINDNQPVLYTGYCAAVASGGGACGNGNGSLDPNVNPCLKVLNPWENEMLAEATDGSHQAWRIAHHLGTGCQTPWAPVVDFTNQEPNGMQSMDGKLMAFASYWLWGLGNDTTSVVNKAMYPGSPGTGTWQATTGYTSGQVIYDGTNFEKVTTPGTSKSGSPPSWSVTSGGTTSDGTVTWTMFTGCKDTNGTYTQLPCRADMFVVLAAQ